MQDIRASSSSTSSPTSRTSSGHLAGITARESDKDESSFHFVSLAYDTDLPSPRMFPIFDGYNSLFTTQDPIQDDHEKLAAIGDQFRTLFVGDERDPMSSSSEAEDGPAALEGVSSGSYCVWSPKRRAGSESSTGWCRKSKSTGSTTNWLRLRDLIMRRSNSDGKVKLLDSTVKDNREQKMAAAAAPAKRATKKVSPQEIFYVRNKALREEERRKTYLPYRRGLIGILH